MRLWIACLLFVAACTPPTAEPAPDAGLAAAQRERTTPFARALTSFELRAADNRGLAGNLPARFAGTTISLVTPLGEPRTALVPSFTASDGDTVTVGDALQISGVTANDFTGPVTYRVTAEDGSTQDYLVEVTGGMFDGIEAGDLDTDRH